VNICTHSEKPVKHWPKKITAAPHITGPQTSLRGPGSSAPAPSARPRLISDEGCWACYLAKNPEHDIATAQNKILHSLERLEMRRPLEMIESATAREQARRVRGWFREVFCRRPS